MGSSMPSAQPSSMPSSMPSAQPSAQPSDMPSAHPSSMPSAQPSSMPSAQPSSMPSAQPSAQPSSLPSSLPSSAPSDVPSSLPSAQPSSMPSSLPSSMPSSAPSAAPSSSPSLAPSAAPSSSPSVVPSTLPSWSPSAAPSSMPSAQPSDAPSSSPSSSPSDVPSSLPSDAPSSLPSSSPSTSMMPTAEPTGLPSQAPTSFCEACAASCHGGFAAKLGAGHRMTIIGDQAKVYDTTDTTAQLPDLPGANDRSTPANFVLLQPHNQSTPYEFEYEGVEYKFVDPVVAVYSSDVTMVGSATSEGGGTLTVGGFQITQINYDFTFSTVGMEKQDASDEFSDTPAPPSTSVSTFGAIKNARYQYTIVKNVDTKSAFRVLTGKMENLLLSASVGGSQYLNGFRAYTATIPATNDAYCDNQDAPTSPVGYLEDATSNIFRNEVVPD